MNRSLLLLPALAFAVFGSLLALDIINFEEGLAGETSAIDRWVMILSFAAAAICVGLAISDNGIDEDDHASGRSTAARKVAEGRPNAADLPSKPGSLLKKQATAETPVLDTSGLNISQLDISGLATDEVDVEDDALAIEEPIDAPVSETAAPFTDPDPAIEHEPVLDVVAVPDLAIDPVDAELQSLIDEDQMQEINDLVAAADDDGDIVLDADEPGEIVPGTESVEPLARLELRLADYDDEDLKRVVKESESVVIAEMVRSGQLTSEGELTQQDIASMIFLAYTSDEMLAELRLRKSIDADAQPGLDASTGSDFAPLKNIE